MTGASPLPPSEDQTILEWAVRERMTAKQISAMLDSKEVKANGSRGELAEQLLAVRSLEEREVLAILELPDLRAIARQFHIELPGQPKSGWGRAAAFFTRDEAEELRKALLEKARGERNPIPTTASHKLEHVSPSSHLPTAAEADRIPPAAAWSAATPPVVMRAAPSVVPGPASASALARRDPSFDGVCEFVNGYWFRENWSDEEGYEAELFGALTAQFGKDLVTRQRVMPGGRPDLRVDRTPKGALSEATVVEIKVPASSRECADAVRQAKRYVDPGLSKQLLVVILGMRHTKPGDLEDAATQIENLGVRVGRKYHHG